LNGLWSLCHRVPSFLVRNGQTACAARLSQGSAASPVAFAVGTHASKHLSSRLL
jgi:hypothetical protein